MKTHNIVLEPWIKELEKEQMQDNKNAGKAAGK